MEEAAGHQDEPLLVKCQHVQSFAKVLIAEVMRTRVLTIGAAVAFFFLMSLVPMLMVASAMLSALPIPNLFDQLLGIMAMLVPPDAMTFVSALLKSIRTAHPVGILSFGVLSYLWSSAGSFSSLIEALNIAYDVRVERSWIRDRLQALFLALICGGLSVISILATIAGPHFLNFVSYVIPLPQLLHVIWPPLRIALNFAVFVTMLSLIYIWAPNRTVHWRKVVPGALFAVAIWALGSFGLDMYADHFTNFSATYGSLGAIIALMFWLYLTSIAILIGAEMNAELHKWQMAKANAAGAVMPPPAVPAGHAAEPAHPASDVA